MWKFQAFIINCFGDRSTRKLSILASKPIKLPYKRLINMKFGTSIYTEASVAQWLACWTVVPKIAGSNPAEAFGFFMSVKNPSVCLPFGWGSKAGGPMS